MNALARVASSAMPRQAAFQRRSMATGQLQDFKKNWLSDVSAYPMAGILSAAVVGAFSFIAYKLTSDPAVRVITGKGEVLRK